ncbi:hypothetical protein B0T16DRAFT_100439 [Cercophora newfieldiana]|uniref:Uncharacterized protein n=1 Tax=Cercophora newfieldiana TaxID=92897 RepID=A0AA40CX21_9PEZI|nr:hypothetical protein B0T16DRAFT_100439 [Cercophora newfieldiana]
MSASRAFGLQFSKATGRPALSRWTGTRRLVSRRGYASAHGKPSSDMPWLITSVVVSVPIGIYIWRQGPGRPKASQSAHGGHENHGTEHEEVAEKEDDTSKANAKEMDDSHENQAAKLTDKPDSKRVDPAEK